MIRQYFLLLLLLSGISGQAVFAEETAPAGAEDTATEPVDQAPKPVGKKPEDEEEEPDCE